MYLPTAFEEQRPEALHALMQAHPLGTLVTHGPDGLDANHIPFELDTAVGPHGLLRAHVARANPVWRALGAGVPSVVMFRGSQAYITPGWYPGKA